MIASCIDRMSRDACGGCERRDACASPMSLFRSSRGHRRRAYSAAVRARSEPSPFLRFLAEVAKAFEPSAKPRPDVFRSRVEARIEPLLAAGPVRMETVARDLGVSRQTLYRRLREEGVTFEGLVDAVRRRLALRLIRTEGVSVKEAAYRLGFADPAAFSRAFKRWTGRSPSESRRPPRRDS